MYAYWSGVVSVEGKFTQLLFPQTWEVLDFFEGKFLSATIKVYTMDVLVLAYSAFSAVFEVSPVCAARVK